jgi:hypothetical protein
VIQDFSWINTTGVVHYKYHIIVVFDFSGIVVEIEGKRADLKIKTRNNVQ